MLPTRVASGNALKVSENILNTRSLYLETIRGRMWGGVLGSTFALKAVHFVHIVCFVVSAVDMNGSWVEDFVGVEEHSNFC